MLNSTTTTTATAAAAAMLVATLLSDPKGHEPRPETHLQGRHAAPRHKTTTLTFRQFQELQRVDERWQRYGRVLEAFLTGRHFKRPTDTQTPCPLPMTVESAGPQADCARWIFVNCTLQCGGTLSTRNLRSSFKPRGFGVVVASTDLPMDAHDVWRPVVAVSRPTIMTVTSLVLATVTSTHSCGNCSWPMALDASDGSYTWYDSSDLTGLGGGAEAEDERASLDWTWVSSIVGRPPHRQCLLWDDEDPADLLSRSDYWAHEERPDPGPGPHEGYATQPETPEDPWRTRLTTLADVLTRSAFIASLLWPMLSGLPVFSLAALCRLFQQLQLIGAWAEIVSIVRNVLSFLPLFIMEPLDLLVQFITPILNLLLFIFGPS